MNRFAAHPLGPLLVRQRARSQAAARGAAVAVTVAGAGLMALASWLTPSASGVGTHRQLGYPPCVTLSLWGVPCPTCGMTTAFAWAVRGRWASAFHAQPAGLALSLATMAATVYAFSVAVTGRVWAVNWYRVAPTRVMVAVLGLLAAGWAYKVASVILTGAAG